ncbi:MAG: NAD-dependent epimerase/dehydratase family protein [Propionibacteriaceae bacterium]|nr:NAD-dependent epimerase/dehydratase family protein [Propionibacteriaceae bacterium]
MSDMPRPVAMTGAQGFLGWHTRSALLEEGRSTRAIPVGERFQLDQAANAVDGSSRVIHLAGVNRGSDQEVSEGNVQFATQLAEALRRAKNPPATVVYANSSQAGNNTPYGDAKERASEIIQEAASSVGASFADVHLPNLFGEHGRPFYNAVTATFCHLLAEGGTPTVHEDRELTLLHAQDAADLLTGKVATTSMGSLSTAVSVTELLERLQGFQGLYSRGEIPDISTSFDRNLFNTFRSYTFDSLTPIELTRHADDRGSFFEIIRTHGGSGQSSFSTTAPGITRGDHFHRRKVERFTVLSGEARISLRRLFTDEIFHFDVTGEAPVAIDMPTMWSHNITNTGAGALYTSFWTDDLFDPANPDTISERV